MLQPLSLPKPIIAVLALVGIGIVGVIDYATGVEYRVFGLYYLPLSLAAWHLGLGGTLTAAGLSTAAWFEFNYLAGLRYSDPLVWVVNIFMQGASFVVVGMLIAAVRTSYLRAHELSRTDPLTSLLNGRAFAEEAARILALGRRHHHAVTLAYIDLDNFKTVNDTLGHHAGDDLLRETGQVLRRALRRGDLAARVGGDEFAVLLPETGPDGAGPLMDRLTGALNGVLKAGRCPVSASVGAVSMIEPPPDLEDLIRQADALMYAAKAAGKDRIRIAVGGPVPAGGSA